MEPPAPHGSTLRASDASTGSADADSDVPPLPVYFSGPLDPTKMVLTPVELAFALTVKEAILDDPELDNGMFSDMMIAQISLIDNKSIHDHINLETAIDRARRLQIFRQEFDILETYADAKRRLVNFIRMVPGHHLHYCQQSNQSVMVLDMTKLPPQLFLNHLTEVMSGGYYCHHAMNLDLDAIRRGNICIWECQGFKWKHPDMFNLETLRLGMKEIWDVYPHQFTSVKFCNTGVFVNLLVSMVKKVLTKELRDSFEVGIVSEERLDRIFLVPTPEAAMERVERHMCEALKRRFEAEKTFTLENTEDEQILEARQDPPAN